MHVVSSIQQHLGGMHQHLDLIDIWYVCVSIIAYAFTQVEQSRGNCAAKKTNVLILAHAFTQAELFKCKPLNYRQFYRLLREPEENWLQCGGEVVDQQFFPDKSRY